MTTKISVMRIREYIVIIDEWGSETPIIFGETFQHSEMARRLTSNPKEDVISAGFVHITDLDNPKEYDGGCFSVKHELKAYGESVSLNKEARPVEDSKLLNYSFYGRL